MYFHSTTRKMILTFMSTVNESPLNGSMIYLSDNICLPFELNYSDHQYGNDCIDPDLNYFQTFNQYYSHCNYFVGSSFNSEISKCLNTKQHFSMCHLNIRSITKCRLLWNVTGWFAIWMFTPWCNRDMSERWWLWFVWYWRVWFKNADKTSLVGELPFLVTFNEYIKSIFIEKGKEYMNVKKI